MPVNSRNRLAKVEDGSVDLIIATMGDTSKRREQSGLLLPNYYSSGVTLSHQRQVFLLIGTSSKVGEFV